MTQADLAQKVAELRAEIARPHDNPAQLHDEVQAVIDRLVANHQQVPAELREFVHELEAEVVEEFFDNLPV